MAILEKKGRHVTHFLIFVSFWVGRVPKNKLSIFINVNLHVVNGVCPLSAFANCISNPTISFSQHLNELEGLN